MIKTITGSTDDFLWPAATTARYCCAHSRTHTCAHTQKVLQQCQKDNISENSVCVRVCFTDTVLLLCVCLCKYECERKQDCAHVRLDGQLGLGPRVRDPLSVCDTEGLTAGCIGDTSPPLDRGLLTAGAPWTHTHTLTHTFTHTLIARWTQGGGLDGLGVALHGPSGPRPVRDALQDPSWAVLSLPAVITSHS